jgi:serine/threonine-protein kinase RsbW
MKHQIKIFSSSDEITTVVKWIRDIGHSLDLPEKQVFALEVSIEELITNIVWYAFEDKTKHPINVTAKAKHRKLLVDIEDSGKPFNPVDVPPPPKIDNIETARIGGLGIFMAKRLTDGMKYRRAEGKNILTIWINLVPTLLKEELMVKSLTIQSVKVDNILIFTVTGWLNAQSYQKTEDQLDHWIGSGEKWVVGDFTELDFISSIGLRVLMTTSNKISKAGGHFVVFGLQGAVQDVFDSTGISTLITVANSKSKAIEIMLSEQKGT